VGVVCSWTRTYIPCIPKKTYGLREREMKHAKKNSIVRLVRFCGLMVGESSYAFSSSLEEEKGTFTEKASQYPLFLSDPRMRERDYTFVC